MQTVLKKSKNVLINLNKEVTNPIIDQDTLKSHIFKQIFRKPKVFMIFTSIQNNIQFSNLNLFLNN